MNFRLALSLAAAGVLASTAHAQTTWNGSLNSDATNPANWTGTAPAFTATDFNTGPISLLDAFDATNPATNRVVDVGSRNWTLSAGSSAARTIHNFEFISSTASGLTYGSSIVTWSGNNTITGNYGFQNNTINFGINVGGTGQQRIEAGSKLTITGNLIQTNARNIGFFQAGTVEVGGNLNHSTAHAMTVNGTGTTIIGGNITSATRTVTGGTLNLTGTMTGNSNPTTVNGATGTLLIGGTHVPSVNVTAGRVGGDGSITGDLSVASGAQLVFSLGSTLDVAGAVSLDDTFSIASLVNANGSAVDWSLVPANTYTLIGTTASNLSNISNFGLANATDIGGRLAYFDGATGLSLVVVPEPGALMLIGLGLAFVGGMCLRRKKA